MNLLIEKMKLQLTAYLVVCSIVCSVVCETDLNDSWSFYQHPGPEKSPYSEEFQDPNAEYRQYPGVQGKIITGAEAPNRYPVNSIGEPLARPGPLRPSYPSYPSPSGYPSPQVYPSQQEYSSPTRQGYPSLQEYPSPAQHGYPSPQEYPSPTPQGYPSPQEYPSPQNIPPGGFQHILSTLAAIADAIEKLEERVRSLEYQRADVDIMKMQLQALIRNDLSASESSIINRFSTSAANNSNSISDDKKLAGETITPVVSDIKKSCPPKFERIGKDCFYISVRNYQMSTWQGAQSLCSALGARLAAPDTRKKMSELNNELRKSSSTAAYNYWLGGLYPGISWRWVFSGEEVPQDPNFWTFSSTYENPGGRHATYFEPQPTLFSVRQKLLEAGRRDDDLVKLMENITAAVGEDKVAEFVANDTALRGVELDLSFLPKESEARRVREDQKMWSSDSFQHPAESRIETSSIRNFLNPLLSFFNVGSPKKNTLNSMMDSFRYVMGQTREPKAKPVDGTSTIPASSATLTGLPTTTSISSPDGSSPLYAANTLAPSTDSTSFEGTLKSASGTSTPTGRSFPWDKNLGRCLLFQPNVEKEERFFKYAADQCGYRRYFICQIT